ncbi:hypothetical protein [Methylobacterium oxalidis]|uniref:Helix-turn-helix domain-containing protein n=1 Tax=Methylobacterium oxalidis TaxID=944322 RepID=A0A512J9J1_9HYPH|nr:hypothetical protein [Methylobacterium oxalidis]GEP06623.1 hypothetical protein MOX02_46610 [Methylobacterium oxalidis]GJE35396.1 hypothetical protein LDDCCGHA_5614 [Methylobacterium oxalidis]GLS66237.1 hypothetical protein GCM10007888_46190 [Methylobacterium oxalidis]
MPSGLQSCLSSITAPAPNLPIDRFEFISVREGMKLTGLGRWAFMALVNEHGIGRKLGGRGRWRVNRIALQLLLDGRDDLLEAFRAGERAHPEILEAYRALRVPAPSERD